MATSREISIDRARIDDAQALADVYLDSARHHVALDPDYFQVPDAAAIAQLMRERLQSPDYIILVARVGTIVVGSVQLELRPPSARPSMVRPCFSADVGIAVLASHRGLGVGQLLLARAEEWAMAQGVERLTLDCHAANHGAVRLYQRLGYRTTGLFMDKQIAPDG